MPHQFMAVDCKECGTGYCPVCKEKCPKCGEVDFVDEKMTQMRKQMREHGNRNKIRYFSYGSNMDEKQMLERCPQSERQEKTKLSGYEFFINKRGVANIRPNKSKSILGIIYNITKNDEEKLNRFEGVQFGTNTQELSPLLNAFYYVAKETNEGSPKKGYLEKIIKAGEDNGFSKEYIDELKSWQK